MVVFDFWRSAFAKPKKGNEGNGGNGNPGA